MLSDQAATRISKTLSLVLRHNPAFAGVTLDENGWTDVATLLTNLNERGIRVSPDALRYVVETNAKRRFAFSPDGARIRANQGHSVAVDLALPPTEPPTLLYHGTATRLLDNIRREGLKPMARHHVHLSADPATARQVGRRHGHPVVLAVDAGSMQQAGYVFYRADNGVWLTDRVPPDYLSETALC